MVESEVSTECSSPTEYTEKEIDQQLLEWAGKLELESIDLREKSSKLLKALQTNSSRLQQSCEKMDIASNWFNGVKVLKEDLETVQKTQNATAHTIEGLGPQIKESETRICSKTELLGEDFKKAVSDSRGLLLSLTSQSENMLQIMQMLSTEMQRVSQRQVSLESQVHQLNTNLVTWKDEIIEHVTRTAHEFTPLTKSNKHPAENHRITKPVSPALSREHTRRLRTQTTAGTRWIIPWDEISGSDTLLSSEL